MNKRVYEYWSDLAPDYEFNADLLYTTILTFDEDTQRAIIIEPETEDEENAYFLLMLRIKDRYEDIRTGASTLVDGKLTISNESSIMEIPLAPETIKAIHQQQARNICDINKVTLDDAAHQDIFAAVLAFSLANS